MRTHKLAVTSLLCIALASGQAIAGKPDRDPANKDCDYAGLGTACSMELGEAYDLVGSLISNNGEVETFLSRNPAKDAGTLQCKLSGAEIKFAQGKTDEAIYLVDDALAKIESLHGQGKLSYDGKEMMGTSFNTARDCLVANQ